MSFAQRRHNLVQQPSCGVEVREIGEASPEADVELARRFFVEWSNAHTVRDRNRDTAELADLFLADDDHVVVSTCDLFFGAREPSRFILPKLAHRSPRRPPTLLGIPSQ